MENKEYYVGIDFGNLNSRIGIYMNNKVIIIPNNIGESSTPSLVLFDDKGIFSGEEVFFHKKKENNLIFEFKDFIGLNYDEFIEGGFEKRLNYEVINQDGIPKIKVNIKGIEEFYSAEEISAFLLKKLIKNAEDFVNENEQGIKITKAVITVPSYFTEKQKDAIKTAARAAFIKKTKIINEPIATAIAYDLGKNLIPEEKKKIKTNITRTVYDVAPLPIIKQKTEENIIVFDLGGGIFKLTLLNIKKSSENDLIDFDVIYFNGDNNLGGNDFDNKLMDYCIKLFCEENDINELNINNNKMAYRRLKMKCEAAKKILSHSNEAFININALYEDKDCYIKITKNKFEELCKDLFKKIEVVVDQLLEDENVRKDPKNIDYIILVGGASKMTGIKDLLKKKFEEKKIKDSLDPDKILAFGATLECAKFDKKEKIFYNLLDIIPYNIGISEMNTSQDVENKKQSIYTFIPKLSKFPYISKSNIFRHNLSAKEKEININVYEGNDENIIENNKRLEAITIKDINKIGEIEYKINFTAEINHKLKIHIKIDNKGKEIIKEIKPEITNSIINIKNYQKLDNLKESNDGCIFSYDIDKKERLMRYSKDYEQLINHYLFFIKYNDFTLENVFNLTKQLFSLYSKRISLASKECYNEVQDNISEIIDKIKNSMNNLISYIDYIIKLMDIFLDLKEKFKNEYYMIFANFLELMNCKGIKHMKENKKFSRYYSKLYFEKAFYSREKYIKEKDIGSIDRKTKQKLEEQLKISKNNLDKINSFSIGIEILFKGKQFLSEYKEYSFLILVINKLNDLNNLSEDELYNLLDFFQDMVDSFNKDENPIEKGFCLANIIKLSYKITKNKNYDKLMDYIQRLEIIVERSENNQYYWYNEIKNIIEEVEEKYN